MNAPALHAVTVLGRDRPGIIADTTRILADLGVNIEDTTMTLLRGHFAMMLICAGGPASSEIEKGLAPLTEDGTLTVTVREVEEQPDQGTLGAPYLLSVHGGDRPGIVSTVVGVVAAAGGNITDLTTRLSGALYVLVAEVDLPATADVTSLEASLQRVGDELGVGVTFRPAESDEL